MTKQKKPRLAVWKFASCDGCQLSLLDCEEELLAVSEAIQIANFPEASSAVEKGPYDLSLVEGSITTPHDEERIHRVRRLSKYLVTIGACATSGGIQALRNFTDVDQYTRTVYANPRYIQTLQNATAISDHVEVDFELRGCPVNKYQLLEVINAFLNDRRPRISPHSVCLSCKMKGYTCVMVARNEPCMGPVTHDGCGALCPAYNRGCFACFGPKETPNTTQLSEQFRSMGRNQQDVVRAWRGFNAWSEPFRNESIIHEKG